MNNDEILRFLRLVPEVKRVLDSLVLADSASWMFKIHRCAFDPFPHPIVECTLRGGFNVDHPNRQYPK